MSTPANDLGRGLGDGRRFLGRKLHQIVEHEGASYIRVHAIQRLAKQAGDVHPLQSITSELRPVCADLLEIAVGIEARQVCFQ